MHLSIVIVVADCGFDVGLSVVDGALRGWSAGHCDGWWSQSFLPMMALRWYIATDNGIFY